MGATPGRDSTSPSRQHPPALEVAFWAVQSLVGPVPVWDTGGVIPTAIFAGFVIGLWCRWWAVIVVAVGWSIVVAVMEPAAAPAAAALGAANGAVGLLPALALRRASRSLSKALG
ncbi:MAG: hypothetical protein QOJ23_2241 [Actinomycetota bacterium]|nr:hypothetical protein [Actinomycetota bacterium]